MLRGIYSLDYFAEPSQSGLPQYLSRIAGWKTSQYNIVMPTTFEADVALIHIAGGSSRSTPPPGSVAQSAPRRSARGRSEDLLFLNLSLLPDRSAAPGLTTHLAHLGSEAYYGTPGSVTAGLREVVTTINDRIIDANQSDTAGAKQPKSIGRRRPGIDA